MKRIADTYYRTVKPIIETAQHETSVKTDSERKIAKCANSIALLMQGLDRARISVMLTPYVATKTAEATQALSRSGEVGALAGATLTGLAAGGAFAAWNMMVSTPLAIALDKMPDTQTEISRQLPRTVEAFKMMTPGLDKETTTFSDRLKRGLGVTGIGNTAYTVSASLQEKEPGSTSGMNMAVSSSVEGGVVMGGIVSSLAYGIQKISLNHPELAQDILATAENQNTWRLVALGSIALSVYGSLRKSRATTSSTEDLTTITDSSTEEQISAGKNTEK